MRNNLGRFYPEAKPLAVVNGLRARSTRGAIGSSWWSKRFISILDGFGMGSRLQRGRAYARKGQVISLDITPGLVAARVQGSTPRPYSVRISLGIFRDAQWEQVQQILNQDAWFVASLLDGQMPEDIERVFEAAGLSLFPASRRELSLSCSCPDSAVPCKHLAAAFYLLAERFDEDPFSILAWRGRDRESLLGSLHPIGQDTKTADGGTAEQEAGTPLEEALEGFYQSGPMPAGRSEALGTALLIDQLPSSGVTVRSMALEDVLRPIYRALRENR